MLKAFTDDSGSDPKSKTRGPVFVMAGYLANTETWNNTSDEWQRVLDSPRKLDWFRSAGIQQLDKMPFKNWEKEDAELKASQLSVVIESAPITSFVLCMYWDDFKKAKQEFTSTADIEPYGMLFNGVMASVTDFIIKNRASETVQFEFDEQGKAGEEALSIYREVRGMLPRPNADLILGAPGFNDDKNVLPLQMADMLAWNIRRYISDNDGEFPRIENSVVWFNKPSKTLLKVVKKETLWSVYNYSSLREMFSKFEYFRSGKLSPEDIRKELESERP